MTRDDEPIVEKIDRLTKELFLTSMSRPAWNG